MANDITSIVVSDLSYVKIEDKYNGFNLKDIVNDPNFREAHKDDKQFQKFLSNYEMSPESYNSVLQSNTLVMSKSYNSNYNGIAVINDKTKEVVIGSKGTASFGDALITDREMVFGEHVPQYFSDAKKFTSSVRKELTNPENQLKYQDVNSISFTGHSLGGSVSVFLRIISEGEGKYSYSAKTLEAYGISDWTTKNPYVYDAFNRISFLDEARKEFQDKYAQITARGNLNIENLVNNFDGTVNFGTLIGIVRNVFSPTGEYVADTKLSAFFHALARYNLLVMDENGNIKLGQVNYKNLIKAIQADPDNTANYLIFYDSIKGFAPYGTTVTNSLDRLVEDSMAQGVMDKLFPLGGTQATLNAILAGANGFKVAGGIFVEAARRDPLVVDMDGDGVETLSRESGTHFDLDKNGFAEKTGWVKGDDALLVRDLNGDGKINDGGELFGDQTLKADGTKATTGFEALGELDSNKDEKINADDAKFSEVKVWQDKNGDGITQAEELNTLSERGIKSINLKAKVVSATDGLGNTIVRTSSVEFADGREHKISEYLFDRNTVDTIVTNRQSFAEDIKIMPFMRGFGNSADLHTAISKDPILKQMVIDFINADFTKKSSESTKDQISTFDGSSIDTKFENILFRWMGVDKLVPNSRGSNMDARRLGVLEKLFTEGFTGFGDIGSAIRSTNPNVPAAAQLNTIYDDIKSKFLANITIQTFLKEFVILGALEVKSDGTVVVNEKLADFILSYKPATLSLINNNPASSRSDAQVKFFALASVVKGLATATEIDEFLFNRDVVDTQNSDVRNASILRKAS